MPCGADSQTKCVKTSRQCVNELVINLDYNHDHNQDDNLFVLTKTASIIFISTLDDKQVLMIKNYECNEFGGHNNVLKLNSTQIWFLNLLDASNFFTKIPARYLYQFSGLTVNILKYKFKNMKVNVSWSQITFDRQIMDIKNILHFAAATRIENESIVIVNSARQQIIIQSHNQQQLRFLNYLISYHKSLAKRMNMIRRAQYIVNSTVSSRRDVAGTMPRSSMRDSLLCSQLSSTTNASNPLVISKLEQSSQNNSNIHAIANRIRYERGTENMASENGKRHEYLAQREQLLDEEKRKLDKEREELYELSKKLTSQKTELEQEKQTLEEQKKSARLFIQQEVSNYLSSSLQGQQFSTQDSCGPQQQAPVPEDLGDSTVVGSQALASINKEKEKLQKKMNMLMDKSFAATVVVFRIYETRGMRILNMNKYIDIQQSQSIQFSLYEGELLMNVGNHHFVVKKAIRIRAFVTSCQTQFMIRVLHILQNGGKKFDFNHCSLGNSFQVTHAKQQPIPIISQIKSGKSLKSIFSNKKGAVELFEKTMEMVFSTDEKIGVGQGDQKTECFELMCYNSKHQVIEVLLCMKIDQDPGVVNDLFTTFQELTGSQ